MTMKQVLDWSVPIERYFEEISRIPRESGNEEAISAYLVNFARERGLEYQRDAAKNVVIRKAGSPGRKNARTLMLQAHMDMVCTKRPVSRHDFTRDPIAMYVKDGILRAKDTSLGADDAWGMAYILAVLDDDTAIHPPLECVFTTEEETGCLGVRILDMSQFSARTLISLDGDRDTETFVSCFTSHLLTFEKNYTESAPPADTVWKKLSIDKMSTNVYQGLGHPECGNAIKSLFRLLQAAESSHIPLALSSARGGTGEQYGPEQAEAILGVPAAFSDELERSLRFAFSQMNAEYENTEFCGNLELTDMPRKPAQAMNFADSESLIRFVYLLPNNLFQTGNVSGRLDCVNNIGLLQVGNGKASLIASDRSRFISAVDELETHCRLLAELSGFSLTLGNRYEGWEYNGSSKIKALFNEAIRTHYGCNMAEIVCPGGLEIAYFVKGIPGIDAIEIGVNHDNPHSVDEAMELHSFHKMYRVLLDVLKKINETKEAKE